jgi:hypothetical protein
METSMYRILSGVLICGLAVPAAADKPHNPISLAEQLAALQKEYKAAETAYYKADEGVPDTPEGRKKSQELWKAYDKAQADRFMAAVTLAKADPKSDAGFAALEWVLTIPRAYYLPAGKPALELVAQHHAANPRVGKIIAWVGYFRPGKESDAAATATIVIKSVANKNPDKAARGQAFIAIAWQAKAKFAVAESKAAPDANRLAAEAEKAFEAVLKDYADCPRLIRENAGTLGEVARPNLFEVRHLRIGKVAPDIGGEDLDGVKFKLSDYRRKVVVLDFWGHW